jgi:hypothetical protein
MKFFAPLALLFVILIGCDANLTDPQKIIDNTIAASGGKKYDKVNIEFDFRDRHYVASRNGGVFTYERIFEDTTGTTRDRVTNDGFQREVNGSLVSVPDSMATRYTSSTNSVIYFALLPYGLNDAAVQKKFIGSSTLGEQPYYLVQVTFRPEGGGEDFEDRYLYWINQKTFTIDYLAYSFAEADETSFRFRVAYNPRTIEGIRFQDYINYKPKSNTLSLDQAEELFKKGELVELSKIETENIKVKVK